MGVLNLTPDSFSDGGLFLDPGRATEHAQRLLEEGADLLDLGAESTRPGGGVYGGGAPYVPAQEELGRLLPVLKRLRKDTRAVLSVDTRKGVVAQAALDEGADLINDISALDDPLMPAVLCRWGCPVVLMHSRGELGSMQRDIAFDEVLSEVSSELEASLVRAEREGISRRRVVLDPGIGFGKTAVHNLTLLGSLEVLRDLGRPILVGASRKSFIADVTGAPVKDRMPGSLAATAWAASQGVELLRVHDVAATVQFLKVWRAIEATREKAA